MKSETVFIVAAVGVAGLLAYLGIKKAAAAGSDVAKKVAAAADVTSDKNIVYSGVSKVGAAVTGDSDWSLGTWLYNITHKDVDLTAPTPLALKAAFATEIPNDYPDGWRRFTDGTAIAPNGDYYFKGQLVWRSIESTDPAILVMHDAINKIPF